MKQTYLTLTQKLLTETETTTDTKRGLQSTSGCSEILLVFVSPIVCFIAKWGQVQVQAGKLETLYVKDNIIAAIPQLLKSK